MELMRIVHNLACTLCVFLHVLLIYLIIRKTPKELKSYSILMLIESSMNIMTACCSFLVFYRMMTTSEYMLGAITGPCAYTGSQRLCFSIWSLSLFGHSNYCVFLVFSFRYRYHQIRYSTPPAKYLLLALLIAMIPGIFIYSILASKTAFLESQRLVEVFREIYPNYNSNERDELMIGARFTPANTVGSMWVRIIFIPTYFIVIVSIVQINRLLSALKINERSRALHKQVVRGLTVQSAFPLTYASAFVVYILRKRGWIEPSLAIGFLPMTLTMLNITFSAFSTIFFIKPYRRAVISLITRKENSERVISLASGEKITIDKKSSRIK